LASSLSLAFFRWQIFLAQYPGPPAISYDWLCFANTNMGNEVLVSLLPFSVLLESAGKQPEVVRQDLISPSWTE
jgi:hypothetical protein